MMRTNGKDRAFQALLRRDFRAFVHKAFLTLSPGQTLVRDWHQSATAYQLRASYAAASQAAHNQYAPALAQIDYGLGVLPSVRAWALDPTRRIICVSYSGDLAKKHANDFRAVLESPWYKRLFPQLALDKRTRRLRSN